VVSLRSELWTCCRSAVDGGATGAGKVETVDDGGEASVLALLPKPNTIERERGENGGR
jgi:hypothetical protein